MKDKSSLHLKVQEMCDCYTSTNPLKEMSGVKNESDKVEAAIKWIALTILHGVGSNAKKISLAQSDNGEVAVTAEYRLTELPSPGPEIGGEIINTLKKITHLEKETGKTPLAIGLRDSSVEIEVKLKKKREVQKISIIFPEE